MKTKALIEMGFVPVHATDDVNITGGFCGDLLSWVMGRAEEGQVWFTVIGNANTAAVATLAGVAAVVLCNGAAADETMAEKAAENGIGVYTTAKTEYQAAVHFEKHWEREKK